LRPAVPFSLVSQFSMAFGVNMELMDVRQRSVSASVSTSASMYRIPPVLLLASVPRHLL
jgi:hypothetical protein